LRSDVQWYAAVWIALRSGARVERYSMCIVQWLLMLTVDSHTRPDSLPYNVRMHVNCTAQHMHTHNSGARDMMEAVLAECAKVLNGQADVKSDEGVASCSSKV
jgi:hypothetical protein